MKNNMSFAAWFLTSAATIGAGFVLDRMMRQGRVPGGSLKDLSLRVVDILYRNREFLTGPARTAVEVAESAKGGPTETSPT